MKIQIDIPEISALRRRIEELEKRTKNMPNWDWETTTGVHNPSYIVLDEPPKWKGTTPLSTEEAAQTHFPFPREPQWENEPPDKAYDPVYTQLDIDPDYQG